MYQGVSAKSAEHRKHTENDPKCMKLGWRCIPLAVESYGASWGPEASKAFSQVATRLAIRGNTPKAKIVAELYGRLSLLLVRANHLPFLSPNSPTNKLSDYLVVLCICWICLHSCILCIPTPLIC